MNQETYNPNITEFKGALPEENSEYALPAENAEIIGNNLDNVSYINEFRSETMNSPDQISNLTSQAEQVATESSAYEFQSNTTRNPENDVEELSIGEMLRIMENRSDFIEKMRRDALNNAA